MTTLHSVIKIGESCLLTPLFGEIARRRAGDGRHGEPLRELAQAVVRAGPASAIVLGAGIGEWAADLVAGGVNSLLCVEDDTDSYTRLCVNVSPLGALTHQAHISETPGGGSSPVLRFTELLGLHSSFADACLLTVSARFGPGAIASALDFVSVRRPVLVLEVRVDSSQSAEEWERMLARLAEVGFDGGLAFDPLGHPLGSVTPARVGELIDALESSRVHGGGSSSLTLVLASVERRDLLSQMHTRITRRTRASTAPRIAVVRLDNMGDHVLGAGIFSILRTSFPRSRIVAVIPSGVADLYARCPSVDAILTVPPPRTYDYNSSNWMVLLEYLRGCSRFDLVINPRFADDYYLAGPVGVALAAPGARIVAFRQVGTPRKNYSPNDHFTQLVEAPDTLHVAEYARIMAEALTGRPASVAPEVWWKPKDWETVAPRFGLTAGEFIVFGVGASTPYKMPSLEIYQQILRVLLANSSHPVVLVGSAQESGLTEELVRQFAGSPLISTAGALCVAELAALLAHARLYVGPDAGPKHIAAAARIPVLEIGWVPEDYPARSRGNFSAGRCWTAWDTLTRTVYPDKEAFMRARQHPHYWRRRLDWLDPQHFTQQLERALADLLPRPARKARMAS